MARKKGVDPKQRKLTSYLKSSNSSRITRNSSPSKTNSQLSKGVKEVKKNLLKSPAKKLSESRRSPTNSPKNSPLRNVRKSAPKPQSKVQLRTKNAVEETYLNGNNNNNNEDFSSVNNNNNNNKLKHSPINNNNNNDNSEKPPTPSENINGAIEDVLSYVKLNINNMHTHDSNGCEDNIIYLNNNETIEPKFQNPIVKKDTRIKCKRCEEWFPNRYFLTKHTLREHEDQIYECRICSFNSVDPEKLKSHIQKVHINKKKEKADLATIAPKEELENLIELKVPRKIVMEDGVSLGRDLGSKSRYFCDLCSRMFISRYSLERHVRCHTLEKPFHCTVCDFSSSYREHMNRHMRSVHLIVHSNAPRVKYVPPKKKDKETEEPEEGPKKRRNMVRQRFECAVCGMRSTHKTDLMDHISDKHPNAHIESLNNDDGSKVHLVVTVPKQPKPRKKLKIQCQHCSLIFHDNWKYKFHMRSHSGVKPFQCSVCLFKATSKMTIRDHIHRKHKGDTLAVIILKMRGIDGEEEELRLPVPWREFKCEMCQKNFEDNYQLKLHKQKDHPEALPFTCDVCDFKSFTRSLLLLHCSQEHPLEHLDTIAKRNGKPFKVGVVNFPECNFCHKLFMYRSQLNIHLKLHTGEKTFSCAHCDFRTNTKVYLEKHVEKKHLGIAISSASKSKRAVNASINKRTKRGSVKRKGKHEEKKDNDIKIIMESSGIDDIKHEIDKLEGPESDLKKFRFRD